MKPIPNYENYSINREGTIVQNNNPNARRKELKIGDQVINGKITGHKYVTLCNEKYEWKRIAVHRLVAITYIPNPNNLPEVNHKNTNKGINNDWNLEWCTHQSNIQHSFDNGRVVLKGEDSPLFGRKPSQETRDKMSDKKVGVNHPKFKGWYCVYGKRYNSLNEARKETGLDWRTIKSRCLDVDNKDFTFVPKQ